MAKFIVHAPITMSVICYVEADNEAAAKKAAFNLDFRVVIEGEDAARMEIDQVEMHEYVTRGNVCSAVLRQMDVERQDDDADDDGSLHKPRL